MKKLNNVVQVVNVQSGISHIRHSQCVRVEDEVITSTSVQFPDERADPYTCGYCDKDIPLPPAQNPNRERGFRGT